jgi:hypothetical protein
MKGFPPPEVEGFKFPPYFHVPIPPLCFQSLYDLSAKIQFTTLADFPPWKLMIQKNYHCRKTTLTMQ